MVPLVKLLSPGEQDTEGEHSKSPALDGPAGERVDAPLDAFSQVVDCSDVLTSPPHLGISYPVSSGFLRFLRT